MHQPAQGELIHEQRENEWRVNVRNEVVNPASTDESLDLGPLPAANVTTSTPLIPRSSTNPTTKRLTPEERERLTKEG